MCIDKKGGKRETQSKYSENIQNFCEETRYWISGVRNPDQLLFTWKEKCRGGLVQSRLDYWLVSTGLSYLIKDAKIKPGNSSDHSIITIDLNLAGTVKREKGYWKFNNELLRDKEYVIRVDEVIEKIESDNKMDYYGSWLLLLLR